jgi:hypothetical protein
VIALLHLAMADEIKRGGMIGQMGFQDLFPWRGLAPPASLEGMADQRWRDGEMERWRDGVWRPEFGGSSFVVLGRSQYTGKNHERRTKPPRFCCISTLT